MIQSPVFSCVPLGLRNQAGLLLFGTKTSRNWAQLLPAESRIFVTGSYFHKSHPGKDLRMQGKNSYAEDGFWWEVYNCAMRTTFKGFTSLLPLAFGCPQFSGVGAFRLLQLSSGTRLRETLGCFIDMRNLVLGLGALSCIPHRVKASSSSIKHRLCSL